MTPPERVVEAMPGTLAELAERTEYPVPQVLKFITYARRDGVRVNAIMQPRSENGEASTVFIVDDSRHTLTEEV